MNSTTDEIKSKLNIVDVVGDYVKLEKAGANWRALCPFHSEKSPSFMVSEEKQIWHCFGCQKGGDVFSFVMEMEGLEFKEALKVLADRAGVELHQYNHEATQKKDRTLEILELAARFYEKQLWQGAGGKKILEYLHDRGLKDKTIRQFYLGYAPPGWRNMSKFLSERGYNMEDIVKAGLIIEKDKKSIQNSEFKIQNSNCYDRFRDRIIFPIANVLGKVIGFTSRVAPGGDESQAKYVNTPETSVYHKGRVLYGIDQAKKFIKEKDEVLLVEGNMDVIASHQAGIKNAVAISGTALTDEQLNIIGRYTKNIIMFFDMDEAGQAATLKSAQLAFKKDFNVSVASSSSGKDAADIIKENKNNLSEILHSARPAMEHFFENIFSRYDKNKAKDKKEIARQILEIISHFSSELEKMHWIRKLAQSLDVDEKIFIDAVGSRKSFSGGNVPPDIRVSALRRSDSIRKKIVVLIISTPSVWKKTLEKYKESIRQYFPDSLAKDIILNKGKEARFDFEKIISEINDPSGILEKLYFENKFHLEEGSAEADEEKRWEDLENYMSELKKENIREKIRAIAKDIRIAEENGDREAVKILSEEFSRLARQVKEPGK